MHWLKVPVWKVGDRGFEPHSRYQVSKKQNVSSPLTRKKSISWAASANERCVLGELRSMRLEGSVVSYISPSSRGSPGPV